MSKREIGNLLHQNEPAPAFPSNMRPSEAALYTAISESTLAKLRMRENRSNGPRFVKLSGCVVYRRSDLDAWIDQNVIQAAE